MKSDQNLPQSVQAVLWSYNLGQLDISLHKRVIISQVLNFGTEKAVQWLFQAYGKDEVINQANSIPIGQWDKKSLSLWSLILGIHPVSKVQKMGLI